MGANTATRLHGRNLAFWLDITAGGALTDYSADTMEVTGLPGEVEFGDVTTGGAQGHKHFPGLQKQEFSAKMVCNPIAATGAYEAVRTYQTDTQTRSFEFYPAGKGAPTTGLPKYTGECWIKSIDMPVKTTDVVIMTVHFVAENGVTQALTT